MYLQRVGLTDGRAAKLSNKHYSRKKPGSLHFCPPGNNIVLLGKNNDVLWVSHRNDPNSGVKRQDGFECWDNPYFRNESPEIASQLILQGLAVTLWYWGYHDIPKDGFHSFVDPTKVEPTLDSNGNPFWGYCFLRAGFRLHPEPTKERNLLRFVMSPKRLMKIKAMEPFSFQMRMAI